MWPRSSRRCCDVAARPGGRVRPDCRDLLTLPMREGAARPRGRASARERAGREEELCDEWQRETVLTDHYYTNPLWCCTSSTTSTESTRELHSTDGVNAIAGHAGGLCGM